MHAGGAQTSSWYTAPSGLFSDAPHLVLQEGYWDEATSTRTERFFVIDPATGTVERYALPTVAHNEETLRGMLSEAGIGDIRSLPSLLGDHDEENGLFEVYVGKSPLPFCDRRPTESWVASASAALDAQPLLDFGKLALQVFVSVGSQILELLQRLLGEFERALLVALRVPERAGKGEP